MAAASQLGISLFTSCVCITLMSGALQPVKLKISKTHSNEIDTTLLKVHASHVLTLLRKIYKHRRKCADFDGLVIRASIDSVNQCHDQRE
jgi:hypothetical protein